MVEDELPDGTDRPEVDLSDDSESLEDFLSDDLESLREFTPSDRESIKPDLPDDPELLKDEIVDLHDLAFKMLVVIANYQNNADSVEEVKDTVEDGLESMRERRKEFEDNWLDS